MQLSLPFAVADDRRPRPASAPAPSSGPSRPTADGQRPATGSVLFFRHPRAGRYVIRVRPDGSVRVTIPRGGSRREAEAFLSAQRAWVDRHRRLAGLRAVRPRWGDGTEVLVDGVGVILRVHDGNAPVATLGSLTIVIPPGTIDLRPHVQQALWHRARVELPARLRLLAEAHGIPVARVTVRNQRSRWGSAGPNGHITLNWRLVQMPPHVRDYVLLHELMHLRRADHSPVFWKLVAAACPEWKEARRWLKKWDPLRT